MPGCPPISLDLLLWDVLSHRGLRGSLRDAYFYGSSGILAVADMRRRATLEELGGWIQDVERVSGRIPVVVIGANRDPADRREVTEDDVRGLAESYGAGCFFGVPNARDAVERAFRILAERIAGQKFRLGREPRWAHLQAVRSPPRSP